MSYWLLLLSLATAGFSVVGFVIIWLVDKPWFIKLVPSLYGRIGWCTVVSSGTVLLLLNFAFLVAFYNIYHKTGSPWAAQFSAWGAKWISPFTNTIVIFILFKEHRYPIHTYGEAAAVLLSILLMFSLYWRTPLFGR